MDIIPQKRCTKCGAEKSPAEFCPDKRRPDGYGSHCRVCHRDYKPKHPRPRASRLSPGDTKTCSTCKNIKPVEEFRPSKEDLSGYEPQCKECRRASARAWKSRNRDRIRGYEQQNYSHFYQVRKSWVEHNRDRHLAKRRLRSNTPKGRAYNRNKQALRRTLSRRGDVTPEKLQRLLDSQSRCYYCRKPFNSQRKKTIDHVIPIVRGGEHVMSNLVVCCQSCNSKKRDRLVLLL